jgi:hypothetical protein
LPMPHKALRKTPIWIATAYSHHCDESLRAVLSRDESRHKRPPG